MENKDDVVDGEDYRKKFKTIMCPLGQHASKQNGPRWPYGLAKGTTKFGANSMYASHPMELEFPQTLATRI